MTDWPALWQRVQGRPMLDGHGWSTIHHAGGHHGHGARSGYHWNGQERSDLVAEYRAGHTLGYLATRHGRTVQAVLAQLRILGQLGVAPELLQK